MSTYRITIQYKGTNYLGWQVQPEGRTVQGELNKALEKISKSSEVSSIGSGRTDRGVHALGQVARVTTPLEIGPSDLSNALNSHLPNDIEIITSELCAEDFHPVRDAISKEYIYLFSSKGNLSLFHNEYVSEAPKGLDFELMKNACKKIVGKHDFSDFQCVGTDVSTTVREVFECEIVPFKESWGIFPPVKDVIMLRVVGSGFLKQMVRLLVGGLWSIGKGKVSIQSLEDSLASPTGEKLGVVAPPQGLYLKQVFYR